VKVRSKDDLDKTQLDMLEARFRRLRWVRPILLLILGATLMLVLIHDRSSWRLWTLVALGVIGLLQAVREMARPDSTRRFHLFAGRNMWIYSFSTAALFLATGGFDSPLLPTLVMVCFFIGTITAARNLMALTLALFAVVCGMALVSGGELVPDLMPAVFGGGPNIPQPTALLWAKAGGLMFALAWAGMTSYEVRHVFRQIAADALDARDEVLVSYDAHARELTALSGELAHELKNPLANLKGLAVLVGRDVHGKGVERLQVLQHEISRMEEVLRSFLTFARPLAPLSEEEVDLRELCTSVVTLHEGMAHARGVDLKIDAHGPIRLTCDQRKVKRILINLVQNALEASAPDDVVELSLRSDEDGRARAEVLDRGRGIDASVREHLFEPGVTTKSTGTGLGLALSRGLARQHGGELTLEDREGGGCVATLTLPERSAVPEEESP